MVPETFQSNEMFLKIGFNWPTGIRSINISAPNNMSIFCGVSKDGSANFKFVSILILSKLASKCGILQYIYSLDNTKKCK